MASKTYRYPVNQRNSTVLGYAATGKTGSELWGELQWNHVCKDGGFGRGVLKESLSEFLDVMCKHDRKQDGPERRLQNRRWYRVRCVRCIGSKWRGGTVVAVRVEKARRRGWEWIVEVEKRDQS